MGLDQYVVNKDLSLSHTNTPAMCAPPPRLCLGGDERGYVPAIALQIRGFIMQLQRTHTYGQGQQMGGWFWEIRGILFLYEPVSVIAGRLFLVEVRDRTSKEAVTGAVSRWCWSPVPGGSV